MGVSDDRGLQRLEERAAQLKERVYLSFAALAVVLALSSHTDGLTVTEAATTLAITVFGVALAVFVADLVSHLVVQAAAPDRREVRHMVRVSLGSLGTLALPFAFIGLAALEVWNVEQALRASSYALVVTLGAVGYLAVRRVPLPRWQRLIALAVLVALGCLVVALELLAHLL